MHCAGEGGGGHEGASGSAGTVCWQRADFKAIGDFKALAHNGMKYFLKKLYYFHEPVFSRSFRIKCFVNSSMNSDKKLRLAGNSRQGKKFP